MNHWIKVKRITSDGETMFEARCDMFPDAAVFEDTATEAYDSMCEVVDDLLIDLASDLKKGRK